MSHYLIRIAAAAVGLLAQVTMVSAGEIKLYSTIAFRGALDELVPQYQKATGNKLTITYGQAAQLAQRIASGEAADVAILTRANIDALVKDGKVTPESDAALASASMAVAVKVGAVKPDVSTPEAFRSTLLAAKSIATSDPAAGGASSVYFSKLLERMGLTDQVKGKLKVAPAGKSGADVLAAGDAEIGVMQTSELLPGTELAGVFPSDLNNVTEFAVGLATKANEAGSLISFLQSSKAAAIYRAKGLYPN